MNSNKRFVLGLALLFLALFWDKIEWPTIKSKLEKPSDEIVVLVDDLEEIDNKVDSNKVAAVFNGVSEKVEDVESLNTNLQMQYFLDFVGKKVMGSELMDENGYPKYPMFAPSAAKLIAKVLGPQDETDPITATEKEKVADLFYGFSWKLYKKAEEAVFDQYKEKTLRVITEYNKKDDEPSPEPAECTCDGTGYITHGDGHKTPCPCDNCKCKMEAIIEPPTEVQEVKEPVYYYYRRRGPLRRLFGR